MKFYIVDVFVQKKFSGNQVAVVENSGDLNDDEMQKIAREINFTETVFVQPEKTENKSYAVRIFTPEKEVEFSGHALLGCAYIVLKLYVSESLVDSIALQLPQEIVNVSVESQTNEMDSEGRAIGTGNTKFWIQEQEPVFGRSFEKILLSRILSIVPEKIDESHPIIEVDTGLPMIIVPLTELRALQDVRINKKRYRWLISQANAKCILAFTSETYNPENDVNVRVFADFFGIPEDAVTGSGNGVLAAYLSKYDYFSDRGKKMKLRIEQGYEIDRPSLLFAKCEVDGDRFNVRVGGNVVLVAEGKFLL